MRRLVLVTGVLILALAIGAAGGFAAYPERPVKLIVPWPAGGDTDGIFRPFAQQLQKHLGATVVVANVAGASGTVGAREAKNSPPDGYTIYAVHDYIHSTYYTGVADVAYTDFEPVCSVSSTPAILTASPKTPWSSYRELVADAKARPGQITVAATLGSTSHFFPALIEKAAGITFKYVSYEGLAPRMNALLGGHVDLGESNLTQKGKVDAGQLKFLAIATEARHPDVPGLPTLKELGVNVVYAVTRGLMVPRGSPADVVAKLEAACAKSAGEAKFAEDMAKQGTAVRYLDRQAYARFLRQNDQVNKDLARDLGLLKRP
jgi:tripartite-type tricarboxylate transporter receptor subunit TctC